MKKLLLVLIVLPTIASAQFMTKPNVLELKKYRTSSGRLELRYISENPRQILRIGAGSKATNDFFEKLMKSEIVKLNCDGDFFPMMDQFGQYIHVNSLKSCVDEDGDVIAHSIGLNALSDADVAKSKKYIEDSLKTVVGPTPANVNDSSKPKIVADPTAGVFSPKLKAAGTQK